MPRKPKTDRAPLVMHISTEQPKPYCLGEIGDSCHIFAAPRILYKEDSLRYVTANQPEYSLEDENAMYYFRVYSQGCWRNGGLERELFAWHCEYHNCYSVDLERANAMSKQLTKIERELTKFATLDGRATTFGHYLLRVARAIGATQFAFDRTPEQRERFGSQYRITDLAGGRNQVEQIERQWVELAKDKVIA